MGTAGTPLSFGMGGVADTKIHAPPHMSYLAECGRSALKYVVIKMRTPNREALGPRPLGWCMADPLKTNPVPICVTTSIFVVLCKKRCTHK